MTKDAHRILDELGALVRQLARLTGGPDDMLLLTGTQRLALYELGSGGPLRLVDLAELLGVTAPTASRAVDALESHGLVERQQDPDDRRAQRIALTPNGQERFAERNGRVAAVFEPAAQSLSREERAQLASLLARLRGELSP
jgi:DNA-binding MarR family transcriptional regulator